MSALFYILYSQKGDKFYIGHTTESISERLRKHNSGYEGFTGKHRDWQVVYTASYPTKREAYEQERMVKKWKSRKKIVERVQSIPIRVAILNLFFQDLHKLAYLQKFYLKGRPNSMAA